MLLPRLPYGHGSSGLALADDAEAVGVVDVEERAVAARDLGEGAQVRRVARHAVHAVHADEPRAGRGSARSSSSRWSGSSKRNRRTAAPRDVATWQPS